MKLENFWTRVSIRGPDDCWEWGGPVNFNGYGRFTEYVGNYKSVTHITHRVAWSLHNKRPIPKGMFVLHSCHNRVCCNPQHLRLGTPQENSDDMKSANRQDRSGRTKKLTEQDVINIRKIYCEGKATYVQLSRQYNVTVQHLSEIVSGKKWKHVPFVSGKPCTNYVSLAVVPLMLLVKIFAYVEYRLVMQLGCPSVREIQEAVGATSTREVKQALDKLVEMGYIIRTSDKARNLKLGRLPTENELRRLAGFTPKEKVRPTIKVLK